MRKQLHPAVLILREEISKQKVTYHTISMKAGIAVNRFKNIMSGRTDMTLNERDGICEALGLTPEEVIHLRRDPRFDRGRSELNHLPLKIRGTIFRLCRELQEYYKKS